MTSRIGGWTEDGFGLFDDVAAYANDNLWGSGGSAVQSVNNGITIDKGVGSGAISQAVTSNYNVVDPLQAVHNCSASDVVAPYSNADASDCLAFDIAASNAHSTSQNATTAVDNLNNQMLHPPLSMVGGASTAVSTSSFSNHLDTNNEPIPDEPTCSEASAPPTLTLGPSVLGNTTMSPATNAPILQLVNGKLLLQAPLQQVQTANGPMMVVLVPGCVQQLAATVATQQQSQADVSTNLSTVNVVEPSAKSVPSDTTINTSTKRSTKGPRVLAPRPSTTKRQGRPRNDQTPTHTIDATPPPQLTPQSVVTDNARQPLFEPVYQPSPNGLTVQLSNQDASIVTGINAQIAQLKATNMAAQNAELLQRLEQERMRILSTAFMQQHRTVAAQQLNCVQPQATPPAPLTTAALPPPMLPNSQQFILSGPPQPKLVEINGQKYLVVPKPFPGNVSDNIEPQFSAEQQQQQQFQTPLLPIPTSSANGADTVQFGLMSSSPWQYGGASVPQQLPQMNQQFAPAPNAILNQQQATSANMALYGPSAVMQPAVQLVGQSQLQPQFATGEGLSMQMPTVSSQTTVLEMQTESGVVPSGYVAVTASEQTEQSGLDEEQMRRQATALRMKLSFEHDVERVTKPDMVRPFGGVADVVDRLLPYNIYHESDADPEQLASEDASTQETLENLMANYQNFESRLRLSFLKDTLAKRSESMESSLISYLLAKHETELLVEERQLAQEDIDLFVRRSAIIRSNRPDFDQGDASNCTSSDDDQDFEDVYESAHSAGVRLSVSPITFDRTARSAVLDDATTCRPSRSPLLDETDRAAAQLRSEISTEDNRQQSSSPEHIFEIPSMVASYSQRGSPDSTAVQQNTPSLLQSPRGDTPSAVSGNDSIIEKLYLTTATAAKMHALLLRNSISPSTSKENFEPSPEALYSKGGLLTSDDAGGAVESHSPSALSMSHAGTISPERQVVAPLKLHIDRKQLRDFAKRKKQKHHSRKSKREREVAAAVPALEADRRPPDPDRPSSPKSILETAFDTHTSTVNIVPQSSAAVPPLRLKRFATAANQFPSQVSAVDRAMKVPKLKIKLRPKLEPTHNDSVVVRPALPLPPPGIGLEQSEDEDDREQLDGVSDSSEELGVLDQLRQFLRENSGDDSAQRTADGDGVDDVRKKSLLRPLCIKPPSNEEMELGGFVRDDVDFYSPPAPTSDGELSEGEIPCSLAVDRLRNETRSIIERLGDLRGSPSSAVATSNGTLKLKIPRVKQQEESAATSGTFV